MSEKLSGALEVDATRGRHNQFVVSGRQLAFAEEFFVVPRRMVPNQNGSYPALTPEGERLYKKVEALGGKGVQVTGVSFSRFIPIGLERTREQHCFRVEDIEADESMNPKLDDFLEELLAPEEEEGL
jgi:hypothetical protein